MAKTTHHLAEDDLQHVIAEAINLMYVDNCVRVEDDDVILAADDEGKVSALIVIEDK